VFSRRTYRRSRVHFVGWPFGRRGDGYRWADWETAATDGVVLSFGKEDEESGGVLVEVVSGRTADAIGSDAAGIAMPVGS